MFSQIPLIWIWRRRKDAARAHSNLFPTVPHVYFSEHAFQTVTEHLRLSGLQVFIFFVFFSFSSSSILWSMSFC